MRDKKKSVTGPIIKIELFCSYLLIGDPIIEANQAVNELKRKNIDATVLTIRITTTLTNLSVMSLCSSNKKLLFSINRIKRREKNISRLAALILFLSRIAKISRRESLNFQSYDTYKEKTKKMRLRWGLVERDCK